MKKSILKTVATIAIVSLFSCSHVENQEENSEEKSDLEKYGLVGKVKSVTSVCYDIYDKFGEGYLQKLKPKDAVVQISSFDSLGNILLEKYIIINNVNRIYTTVTNNQFQQTKWLSYNESDDTQVQFGHNYYYDEKGNVIKDIDVTDNSTTNYKNEYDGDGRIISHIGGSEKKYWYYENGSLVRATEAFYDMKTELFYKDGLLIKDVRNPEVYWTHQYDSLRRSVEDIMYKNDNINKKIKSIYCNDDCAPKEMIEWNADGTIEHDYTFSYFSVNKDTMTIFKYDKDKLIEINSFLKDSQGITKDTYKTRSNLLQGHQYIYENGNLVTLRDLNNGTEHKYIDDIVTITENECEDFVTETKYKRNDQISMITKDENGNILYSDVVDGDEKKKTITIVENGETKRGEQIFDNGKLVKFTEATNGLTSTVSYNEAGYMSEVKRSDGTVFTYKYEYDAQGNWVKEIEYENGKPSKLWERSIIYY